MKKVFSLLMIAVVVYSFTSCKKKDDDPTGNYNCTCTFSGFGTGGDSSYVLPFVNVKKSQATSSCAAAQTTYSSSLSGTGITVNCKL